MIATSKSSYKSHRYSGPRKSRKGVRAQLKRNNGGEVSREDVWRKKRKIEIPQNEAAESTGQNIVKTYSRQVPVVHVEATFDTKSHQPSTSTSSETKALEINWPVTDPTLASHELCIEKNVDNNLIGLTGNRIVDIQHILHWAFALGKHTKTCASSTIEFVRELQTGFNSTFIFKCSMCDKEFRESSNENSDGDKLNTGFVWGTVTGGGYYTQASHITNVMDIPTMCHNKFRKIEKSLGDTWKDQLTEEIKKVGDQERAIAIENGQITDDGIPYIEVEVDGGSAKKEEDSDTEEETRRPQQSLPDLSLQDKFEYDEDSQPVPKKTRLNSSEEEPQRTDPDELFLFSCAPILKRLNSKQNAAARLKILQVLYEAEFGSQMEMPYVVTTSENGFGTIDGAIE